jgi:hypothetical protein
VGKWWSRMLFRNSCAMLRCVDFPHQTVGGRCPDDVCLEIPKRGVKGRFTSPAELFAQLIVTIPVRTTSVNCAGRHDCIDYSPDMG